MQLLDAELISLLEAVAAVVRRGGGGGMSSGGRKGVLRGGNEEFADYRQYQQGDDLRRIDWKPYLRLDELVLKVFARSTAGDVHLLLDCSASMATPDEKRIFALRLTASLGYLALCGADRLTVWVMKDGNAERIGPMEGKHSVHHLAQRLESAEFGGKTELDRSSAIALENVSRKSEAVLLSDMWFENEPFDVLRPVAARGASLCAVHISTPHEHNPEPLGSVRLEDSETGESLVGFVGEEAANRFRELFAARVEELRAKFASLKIGFFSARSDDDLKSLVVKLARG